MGSQQGISIGLRPDQPVLCRLSRVDGATERSSACRGACVAEAQPPADRLHWGLEIGAISIATTISDYAYAATPRQEWRTFVVRKQPKDHGLGKLIEGVVEPGDRAVIVDDVLTSGGSLLKAVAAARGAGLVVTHALVIVDRKEQDGRHKVEAEGLTLLSLLTIDDLTSAHPTHS